MIDRRQGGGLADPIVVSRLGSRRLDQHRARRRVWVYIMLWGVPSYTCRSPAHPPPERDVIGASMQGEELHHNTGSYFTIPPIPQPTHLPRGT